MGRRLKGIPKFGSVFDANFVDYVNETMELVYELNSQLPGIMAVALKPQHPPPEGGEGGAPPIPIFEGIITLATFTSPRRWIYTVARSVPMDALDGWQGIAQGGQNFQCRNRAENQNDGSDIVNYGEDISDTPEAIIDIGPVRIGSVVQVTGVPNDEDPPTVSFWFDAPNPLTVTCIDPDDPPP